MNDTELKPPVGACKGEDTNLFFSDDFDDITAAKKICLSCDVREECLEYAIAAREQYGIWGGHRFVIGQIILNGGRPGRPRRNRPRDTWPEVPLTINARERVKA
jgi:WhiB family redox-sensing transcriptional regulator